MKKITEQVFKYQAKDGRVFDTQNEVIDHEMRIDGLRKTCPRCNGEKSCIDPYEYMPRPKVCDKCNGKGYVDRRIVEVWE